MLCLAPTNASSAARSSPPSLRRSLSAWHLISLLSVEASSEGVEGGSRVRACVCVTGAGMSAGILGTLVVNPLDVRKVRMQQGKSGNVVHIVREGGAAALYKGLAANVTRGATVTAVEFSLFDQLKVKNASAPPVCVLVFSGWRWIRGGQASTAVCPLQSGPLEPLAH